MASMRGGAELVLDLRRGERQHVHVERQVDDADVQEHRREQPPRVAGERVERQVAAPGDQRRGRRVGRRDAGDDLQQPDADVHRDQHAGGDGEAEGGTRCAGEVGACRRMAVVVSWPSERDACCHGHRARSTSSAACGAKCSNAPTHAVTSSAVAPWRASPARAPVAVGHHRHQPADGDAGEEAAHVRGLVDMRARRSRTPRLSATTTTRPGSTPGRCRAAAARSAAA